MEELIGYLFAFDAVITWALASLVYKFFQTDLKANIFFRLICVSSFTFIVSLFIGSYQFFLNLSKIELISYFLMCFISGGSVTLGDLLYFAALKRIDASRAYPLSQLSLVFVYPFAFIFFGEIISPTTLIGGIIILSSVFFLSKKDKPKQELVQDKNQLAEEVSEEPAEEILIGVSLAIGTAVLWALAIISFNQARIISDDVFSTNFIRIALATLFLGVYGLLFDKTFFLGFKKENKDKLKYFGYIGIAGSLSLGLADSLFYKAAQINGLVLTSSITANTPMAQQLFSILFLKEKFRPRFVIAVGLIILGNYLIIFL